MKGIAVVFEGPERLDLREVGIHAPGDGDVVVDIEWSGISTGTERLLWTGKMPPFPGLAYPLVPGYESVGRVVAAGAKTELHAGDRVFVPGSNGFTDVRGLFGGAASRVMLPAARVTRIGDELGAKGVLLALAATARHALAGGANADLIVGHGVLGRLLARIAVATGGEPVVWEKNPTRAAGAEGYRVIDPESDPRRDYRSVYDVSGDAALVESLIGRIAKGGEIVLAGFYDRISFAFPAAFMKEARFRVAAEWQPHDLEAVLALVDGKQLSLDGLITHERPYGAAREAYATAFGDPDCLKMLLDWRECS